jgi:predicted  nucleic acid-binding Zn-ribbon protein
VKPTGAPVRPAPRPATPPVVRAGGNRAGLQQLSFPVLGSGVVAQEIAADISALQSNVSELQSKASLTDLQADVTQLDQQLSKLAQTLEAVRKQGYAYAGDIDTKLYDAMSQWQTAKPQVDNAIYQQGTALYNSAYALHGPLSQLASSQGNAGRARGLLPSLQSQVNSLLSNANSVESNIRSMYSSIDSEASELESRLWRIENTMKLTASAKFKLAAGESPVTAVPAKLDSDGKDNDMQGFLYLTDKRLIYERKEEIVKKKVLFIATDKELVHEVVGEWPLSAVTSVKASKKGLLGNEDHLDIEAGGKPAHYHINGQDSKWWQEMIEKAKSGGLEGERAAASAGVSIADMTGPITQADIVALQSQVNDLQSRAMLTFAKDALEDMEGKVSNLPRQLSDVRARGYVFEKALESQVQSLGEQWGRIKQTVNDDVRQQSTSLNQTMQGIQTQMAQVMAQSANLNAARPVFMQVKSMAASAEAQAAAAEQAIYGQYDDFQASVETLSAHFDWAGWMLEALASASFTLMATEGGVAAAQANWLRPNSDPMGGVLFLTDQRIIFEEREGEFSVPLEAPLAQVQSLDAESGQGAGQDEEHLKVIFGSGAPASYGLFHLVGPKAEDWATQIGRAMKGDYTSDRAVAIDQAAVDKVKSAPTQCPNCGAAFTKPVLRGQTEITCEFCGAVTRL